MSEVVDRSDLVLEPAIHCNVNYFFREMNSVILFDSIDVYVIMTFGFILK